MTTKFTDNEVAALRVAVLSQLMRQAIAGAEKGVLEAETALSGARAALQALKVAEHEIGKELGPLWAEGE